MQIGFIGLGHMGGPMASNLLKAGHALTVFDLSPAALEEAQKAGAKVAASPRAAAEASETVITMLPAAAHVKAVYLNEDDGVLAGVRAGVPLIDSSTIDPATARLVADAARAHGNPFADATWDAAWKIAAVDPRTWDEIRSGLHGEAHRWLAALGTSREASDVELTGMIASMAHFAYHLGAIRQIAKDARGPKEGTF